MSAALQNHTLLKLTLLSSGKAIGQSFYYSHMTCKRSGILLILCIPNDDWILKQLESVNEHLDFHKEFSFLKNRDYMLRKTLIAIVLSLINALTKLAKIFQPGSAIGYDIS